MKTCTERLDVWFYLNCWDKPEAQESNRFFEIRKFFGQPPVLSKKLLAACRSAWPPCYYLKNRAD